jgi:hypothetical protein
LPAINWSLVIKRYVNFHLLSFLRWRKPVIIIYNTSLVDKTDPLYEIGCPFVPAEIRAYENQTDMIPFLMDFRPCIMLQNRDFTTNLMHNFLYSTVVSYHVPLHVSSVTALILRRALYTCSIWFSHAGKWMNGLVLLNCVFGTLGLCLLSLYWRRWALVVLPYRFCCTR